MSIVHQTIPLHTGFRPHVLTAYSTVQPSKGSVILLHGFPDTNWGWRHLLKPIAQAGFDVFAPSMRGYGPTDAARLTKDEDLCTEKVCQDVDALLTALLIDRAVIVGHDWGGTIAWNFSCHYPHRTRAIASFCTPFFPVPAENPWPKMKANPGRFAYQLFFQSDDARQLLESDVERTLRTLMRASTDEPVCGDDLEFQGNMFGIEKVTGITRKPSPTNPLKITPSSKLLTEGDMKVYCTQLRESGFLNALRWYRNVERNWTWNYANIRGKRVTMPALMVTAADDLILTPSMTNGMDAFCDNLTLVHVKESSHWILQQQPDECARVLCGWLQKLPAQITRSKL
jgi:soluble epoxide hydrolase/lipid-phosphate phosphatase